MRLSSLAVLFSLSVIYALPVREKIRRFLDMAANVESNAPLAIQTPHGLFPIKDINEDNFLDIFGYHPSLQREFEAAKKLRRQAAAAIERPAPVTQKPRQKSGIPGVAPVQRPAHARTIPGSEADFSGEIGAFRISEERQKPSEKPISAFAVDLPPTSVHVDKAPEFGDDIHVGLGVRG